MAQMIVQYEWILENVDREPKTFASKMILFQGAKVFRVSLKNRVKSPVLIFMVVDLNKLGMRVEEVMYGIQGSDIGPATMSQMKQKNMDGDDGNLQLFTFELAKQVNGSSTFVFRIRIDGSVLGYSYQLSDRLAKEQLWDAVRNRNSEDVEFVVKGETFSAHKAILAARSAVFANDFLKIRPSRDGPQQIRIYDAEPSTVEQFLHFIYTGESMGTFANEELLKLAVKYELKTLTYLCKFALEKIKPIQMVSLVKDLKKAEIPSSFIISFGLKIEDIYCKNISTWYKMESQNFQKNVELQHFTAEPKELQHFENSEFYFDVKIVSTIGNYYYEMMDDAWMTDFWSAAIKQQFTNVNIFVGTVKVMEAHRVILSSRSPVLNASLSKINNTGKSIVTFGAEFEIAVVKLFLQFLYTGVLKSSANNKQLLKLATTYEVATLKSMCQLANGAPLDVEDLTNCLLQI